MNFAEWINFELENRGWSRREAARRGNISPSVLDKVINGYSQPGLRFFEGIATAFDISVEEVVTRYKDNPVLVSPLDNQIQYLVSTLPTEEDKEDVLRYVELRHKLAEERGKYVTKEKTKPSGS